MCICVEFHNKPYEPFHINRTHWFIWSTRSREWEHIQGISTRPFLEIYAHLSYIRMYHILHTMRHISLLFILISSILRYVCMCNVHVSVKLYSWRSYHNLKKTEGFRYIGLCNVYTTHSESSWIIFFIALSSSNFPLSPSLSFYISAIDTNAYTHFSFNL